MTRDVAVGVSVLYFAEKYWSKELEKTSLIATRTLADLKKTWAIPPHRLRKSCPTAGRLAPPSHTTFYICYREVRTSTATMRALTDVETQTLFTKLANYTGRSLTQLIAPAETGNEDDRYVFRLHESRVYYVRLGLANLATSVARENLLCLGTCIGKFTKTGKFRMHITALDVIAPHARYKLWVKANGEMPFLYGGNVVKAHVSSHIS